MELILLWELVAMIYSVRDLSLAINLSRGGWFVPGVTWELAPHTAAKHAILRSYLGSWFPILGSSFSGDLFYFDGFAGPGEYSGGEPGSPVIALDAALSVSNKLKGNANFWFSEIDGRYVKHLESVVSRRSYPKKFAIEVCKPRPFESVVSEFLDDVDDGRFNSPSLFVFIDPFGWKGFPMSVVRRILEVPRAEVFINFMYEEINRFIAVDDQAANFDSLFGCDDWRGVVGERNPGERNRKLKGLYEQQLKVCAGAEYVRSFEMRNENNVADYYLFYATQHIRGLEVMKEAMWKVDPSGRFQFSDATNPDQMMLFGSEPDFDYLQKLVWDRFLDGDPRYSEVKEFVVVETPFIESHCKQVLKSMELASVPLLKVIPSARGRKRGTFASSDAVLRFRIPDVQTSFDF